MHQAFSLPLDGLVDTEKLRSDEILGINKDSYIRHFHMHTTRAWQYSPSNQVRAVQTESTFIKLAGPQLVHKLLGKRAKLEKAPMTIFIDDADDIGTKHFRDGRRQRDARARIMQVHSRKMNHDTDELARCTDDISGAQCKAVCVEAGMNGMARNGDMHEDFMDMQAKMKANLSYHE
ncbi:hypothetical protein HPB48_001209 [Haemaphysalis longicornis]|uniref:AAA ATPase AAA+ lid domain-containing protein n=1 Tax=Haemaphysalis longicornis TaxID=44386 RepID=A0A9J6F8Z2_HAELO|nr:hypothetical protein HPB48_001209 [Haemaphysalis longicornis]